MPQRPIIALLTTFVLAPALLALLPGQAEAAHECGAEHGIGHTHGPLEGGCALVDPDGFIDGDARIDAPALAERGPYKVGVRTRRVVNYDEIDILGWSEDNPEPRYDRELTLEIWYPARLRRWQRELTTYHDVLGSGPGNPDRPLRRFEFPGRAARDAYPLTAQGPFPLVVVSHGYPGSRVLLTYLTENLASKGYTEAAVNYAWAVPDGYLSRLQAGTAAYEQPLDPRIRAMVAFAPWGGQFGFWGTAGLAGITVPSLFIAGAQDQTSSFPAIRFLFDSAVNSDRYLLVYQSAIHEVAVNPPPPLAAQFYREWIHYQEPAWDNRRLNNINQHFITAFLGKHLGGDATTYDPYLDISPISNESARDDETDPSYWTGFPSYSAIGMEFHHLEAGQVAP